MTAGADTPQPTRAHRPGRIIERPRLIRQLDAAEAPVILIVGPAGYGKTTLARQWARTLSGVIWVACTPSHRDVVTFSEDVAAGIDALGGNASRFIGEYMRARSNPQRAAREIANALAKRLDEAPVQWLVIDDYQELAESPEVEEMVSVLAGRSKTRLLIASRVRPRWVTTRDLVYGQAVELGTLELALTDDEIHAVVGGTSGLNVVVRQARGWPAVVGLAARLPSQATWDPAASLHQYVADELFQSAPPKLQEQLVDLALLPDLSPATTSARFGTNAQALIADAKRLGFIGSDGPLELHPLLRDFLLTKLSDTEGRERVSRAIDAATAANAWGVALDLILRFDVAERIDPVLQKCFKPLVRSGRLETIRSFADQVRATEDFPPPAVDVVDAEVALRNGNFDLASCLAERAHAKLPGRHELRCRASLIAGRAHFFTARLSQSLDAYRDARVEAIDESDLLESAFGLSNTQVFSEVEDPGPVVDELAALRHASPTNLVRYATAALNVRRFAGYAAEMPLAEALEALPNTPDPKVRTAFTYTSAYILGVRGEYRRAVQLLELFERDVLEYDLDFATPFLNWTRAFLDLGQRRFGEADRHLQRVEDVATEPHRRSHGFNARILRARLMLQTGEAQSASELLQTPAETAVFPSWHGELAATHALALAVQGSHSAASRRADDAVGTSAFVDVIVLAKAARAVSAVAQHRDDDTVSDLFDAAHRFNVWDPVICAMRASRDFAKAVSNDSALRPAVRQLLHRAEDTVLARQLGLVSRRAQPPDSVLSSRELEVLGLMARGMRNKEIAAALFVAESTIKVHVRHILEKLGVQSRSAAVARFERTAH